MTPKPDNGNLKSEIITEIKTSLTGLEATLVSSLENLSISMRGDSSTNAPSPCESCTVLNKKLKKDAEKCA
jgi:hypothetical protein